MASMSNPTGGAGGSGSGSRPQPTPSKGQLKAAIKTNLVVFVDCTQQECLDGKVPFTVLSAMRSRGDQGNRTGFLTHGGTSASFVNPGCHTGVQCKAARLKEGSGLQSFGGNPLTDNIRHHPNVVGNDGGRGVWIRFGRDEESGWETVHSLFLTPWKSQASLVLELIHHFFIGGEGDGDGEGLDNPDLGCLRIVLRTDRGLSTGPFPFKVSPQGPVGWWLWCPHQVFAMAPSEVTPLLDLSVQEAPDTDPEGPIRPEDSAEEEEGSEATPSPKRKRDDDDEEGDEGSDSRDPKKLKTAE